MAGLDVLLLEKTTFPREKVCGDGLTPRAVKELITLGIPTPEEDGWIKNHGLRIIGGGMRLSLPWPDLASFPPYGLVRTRQDFDDILAKHAVKHGARLREGTNVTGPILDSTRLDRRRHRQGHRREGPRDRSRAALHRAAGRRRRRQLLAPVACRWAARSARTARWAWPSAPTTRAPATTTTTSSRWLELWSTDDDGKKVLLPGYGWIFGVGDGTSNVGLGILNTSSAFGKTDYKDVMRRWVATDARGRGPTTTRPWSARSAAPRCRWASTASRTTTTACCSSATPAAWSTRSTARASPTPWSPAASPPRSIAQAFARGDRRPARAGAAVLPQASWPTRSAATTRSGRYFAKMIGNPEVMRLATKYGLPRTTLMKFLLKVMANLAEPHGGDAERPPHQRPVEDGARRMTRRAISGRP